MSEKKCGNCKFHLQENVSGEWVCTNCDGEYFGYEMKKEDKCPDHEREHLEGK